MKTCIKHPFTRRTFIVVTERPLDLRLCNDVLYFDVVSFWFCFLPFFYTSRVITIDKNRQVELKRLLKRLTKIYWRRNSLTRLNEQISEILQYHLQNRFTGFSFFRILFLLLQKKLIYVERKLKKTLYIFSQDFSNNRRSCKKPA